MADRDSLSLEEPSLTDEEPQQPDPELPLDDPPTPSSEATSRGRTQATAAPAPPSPYLTRQEAATYLRCSPHFLDRMRLPFIPKGRCKLYDRVDLDARMQQDKC